MKGAIVKIEGNWAHFKKPETNNNPLTHDFITKTAFIGLIGAVLGIERAEMRPLFPQLSDDLLYGVQIIKDVKKESWAFKLWRLDESDPNKIKRPVQMEFLKNPCFAVAVALKEERSNQTFQDFISAIENSEAKFTPVLGLHNCPAELSLIEKGEFNSKNEEFSTKSFVKTEQFSASRMMKQDFRIGLEKIPTRQNDDFWNEPQFYKSVVYPSENREILASGEHFHFSDGSNWVLL